ncbi:MAG: sensory rhodopsin transducer [Thermus sp.]|uniref:sensory rhodopsin transducer n=1 Tax=Thermus sp. TaxID=275 RepID=UPI00351AEA6C
MRARTWLVPDAYLPAKGEGVYLGHETLCLLNVEAEPVEVWLDFFFEDRDPVEGIEVRLPPKRVLHLRLDRPLGGFEVPREVPYAIRVRASRPIGVQYSRLDVTQPNMAFLSVMAWPWEDEDA